MTTMRKAGIAVLATGAAGMALIAVLVGAAGAARPKGSTPLKEAKLIIEHNATDHDTGFQGFVDSEGWDHLELVGPQGVVLQFDGKGALGELGLTELFFETVEPANSDKPIDELLAEMPAGSYFWRGRTMIDGERAGETEGRATFSHVIPAGPELQWPTPRATVPARNLEVRWAAVTQALRGGPVKIVGYQLIVERDVPPAPNMIGKWGLSMHLPPTTTSMAIPDAFLTPGTAYKWEVLAIEESGNQTLSSGEFRTE